MEEATTVKLRYQKLFSQYAICRRIFSSKNVLTPESEAECHAAIQTFLLTCREEITRRKLANVTPKLHRLEGHVTDCMKHFGMGLGLLGEQGMESIHAEFNTLHGKYNAIPTALCRLKTCAEQHLLAALPKNKSLPSRISFQETQEAGVK